MNRGREPRPGEHGLGGGATLRAAPEPAVRLAAAARGSGSTRSSRVRTRGGRGGCGGATAGAGGPDRDRARSGGCGAALMAAVPGRGRRRRGSWEREAALGCYTAALPLDGLGFRSRVAWLAFGAALLAEGYREAKRPRGHVRSLDRLLAYGLPKSQN